MRVRAFQRYPFTVDVYDYTVANDANGTISYAFKETINVDFATDPTAPRVVIFAEKPLRRNIQLTRLRDRNGEAVMPGAVYNVTRTDPIITTFATTEGYKMQAALANEPTFEDA